MAKNIVAMQAPYLSHSGRPSTQDLFTINLSNADKWYDLGLELHMTKSTLDKIKAEHVKQQACKRAMFKEWLRECPAESCTWSHLIKALAKVDPETAKVVSETIAINLKEPYPQPEQPHITTFPLISDDKNSKRADTTTKPSWTSSLPQPLATEKKERSQTEIVRVRDPSSSLTLHEATAGQPLSTDDSKIQYRTEADGDEKISDDDRSSQRSTEARSISAEDLEYQTAGEEDTVQPFRYQQDVEQNVTFTLSKNPIISKLLNSIKCGNVEIVRIMIENGEITPRTRLQGKRSPLMYAAFHGSKAIVDYLLKVEGFNSLAETDEDGAITLYFAIIERQYEVAKVIVNHHIRQGLGLNYLIKGTPLIIYPASKGFNMICELLLENRADPNMRNGDGETALIVAASHGHKGVIEVLLKFHADIDCVSRKTSRTALEEALHFGHKEATKLLMKASSTAKQNNLKLFSCKTREEISRLINTGAKVNTRQGDETTPIMVHAERGSTDLVQELLYHHANVDLQDEAGETALIKASAHGLVDIVDALIEAGTIINLKKTNGHTALAVAVLNQQPKVVNKLLLAGADPTIKDKAKLPLPLKFYPVIDC